MADKDPEAQGAAYVMIAAEHTRRNAPNAPDPLPMFLLTVKMTSVGLYQASVSSTALAAFTAGDPCVLRLTGLLLLFLAFGINVLTLVLRSADQSAASVQALFREGQRIYFH